MTIPSRPAPPPPNSQQKQHQQQQNNGGGYNASRITIKLPPPPTSKTYSKIYQSTKSTSSSMIKKFPSTTQSWKNDDPFEAVSNSVEKKKIPPPRPPPPKIDFSHYGTIADTVLKKPGPPQSISKLSNIFGRKKGRQQHQLPPNKFPPLSSNTYSATSTFSQQQTYQSRPYAFVPPLVRSNNETELISFNSPPGSPKLKKSNSDCVSVGSSFSSSSNFSSPINDYCISQSQSESGFEDDFTSPADPWDTLMNDAFKDNINTKISQSIAINDFKSTLLSQPVRNLNVINNIKGDDLLSNGKNLIPSQPILTMPTIIKPKTSQSFNSCYYIKKNLAPKPPALIKEESIESTVSEESLPMPSCPPPPPPPIVNNDDSDTNEPSYGIALYDFEGLEEGDLPFRENEKVYILQQLNDNWYFGRNKRGCEGIFPSNYIDIKIPFKDNIKISKNERKEVPSSTELAPNHREKQKAKVLYNFIAEAPEDLSLNENEIVTILNRINDDWLYGVNNDWKRGQFPANFVEFI